MAKAIAIQEDKNIVFGIVKSVKTDKVKDSQVLRVIIQDYYHKETKTNIPIELTLWDKMAEIAQKSVREGVAVCFEAGKITVDDFNGLKTARASARNFNHSCHFEFERNGRKQHIVVGRVYNIKKRGDILTMGVLYQKYNRATNSRDDEWFNAVAGSYPYPIADRMSKFNIANGTTLFLLTGEQKEYNGYLSAFIWEFEVGTKRERKSGADDGSSGAPGSSDESAPAKDDSGSTISNGYEEGFNMDPEDDVNEY